MKSKLSCKKRNAIVKEERASSKMYKRLGFPKQAADEARHAKFFNKQPCKRKER